MEEISQAIIGEKVGKFIRWQIVHTGRLIVRWWRKTDSVVLPFLRLTVLVRALGGEVSQKRGKQWYGV